MATAIGDLVVNLLGNGRPLQNTLKSAQGNARSWASRMRGILGKALAIGGAAGFGMMLKREFAAIDDLAKVSDRIGITTEKLAGLRHAAELTGAGADKLDAGLQTMAKRLGEAARGSGAAVKALDYLGLSAQNLIEMTPDQAFTAIAEAVAQVEDPMQRAALAANIFSKGNIELVNTLAAGKKGLAEMQAEAEKLNLTLSEIDAAKVTAANDAFTRLGGAVRGLFREATIALAPLVEFLVDKLTWLLKKVQWAQGKIMFLTKEIMHITGQTEQAKAMEDMLANFEKFGSIDGPGKAGKSMRDRAAAAREAADEVGRLVDESEKLGGDGATVDPAADAQRRAEAIMRQYETPMQAIDRKLAELWQLRQAGGFTGHEQEYERIRDDLREQRRQLYLDAGEDQKDSGPRFGAAMTKGSRDALSTIYAAMSDKDIEKLQQKANKKLDRIAEGIDEMNDRAEREEVVEIPA